MRTKEESIRATEERIEKFRAKKAQGVQLVNTLIAAVLVVAVVILGVSNNDIHTKLDTIQKTQEDCMNTINLLWQDVDKLQETEPEQTADKAENRLTDAEINLIAGVVMAEAANQGYEGQVAVCEVIKNRSEMWGKTIEEVLTAPKQFAAPSNAAPTSSVLEAIDAVFHQGYSVLNAPATHFHSGPEPYWTANKELVAVIKDHKFWY